ncbi:MAG: anthranilate synthase component I, partial [Hyphomicrobiaceae bacterium]|nr:anthranilate synthase component I [Hyphomicrobiaceae bacterium]
MQFSPDSDSFRKVYDAGRPQVVSTRLVADLETPVSAFLKLAGTRPNAFLFESVEGGAVRGRYSIIGLEPDLIFRAEANRAEINQAPHVDPAAFSALEAPTLDALRALIEAGRIDLPEDLPPMCAGIFGYLGYDTVRLIEELPDINPDVLGLPDMLLI